MDDAGNILLRRYAKSNVYIKSTSSAANEETAIGADVLKAPNQCLEIEKVYKVRNFFILFLRVANDFVTKKFVVTP
jgi:hypothetical protein